MLRKRDTQIAVALREIRPQPRDFGKLFLRFGRLVRRGQFNSEKVPGLPETRIHIDRRLKQLYRVGAPTVGRQVYRLTEMRRRTVWLQRSRLLIVAHGLS